MSKWLYRTIGLLLIVNVVVFLWPTNNLEPAHVHPHKVDVNAGLLRLNKEVEASYRKERSANAQTALSAGGSKIPDNGEAVAQAPTVQCYRLGPFSLKSNFEIAQATLLNAGLEVDASTRAVSRTEVYRVYLGPFAERARAIDIRTDLNNNGVLDHFIRNEPDGSAIVSLGIYSTEAAAQGGLNQFEPQIKGAKLREEVVTLPESHWLYFAISDEAVQRQDLDLIDWGEVGAQIGPFQCRANRE